MGTIKWDGSESGNWGTADNWVGGVAPVAADDVIIDDSSVNIDDGLDPGIDIASLFIGPNYTGEIGTAKTNPLVIGVTGIITVNGGGENIWIKSDTPNIETVIVRKVGQTGTGTLSLQGGTIAQLSVGNAKVKLEVAGTITTCVLNAIGGRVAASSSLEFIAGTITNLILSNGVCLMPEGGTGTVAAGIVAGASILTLTDGTVTAITIIAGGIVNLGGTNNSTTILVYGGTLDTSQSADANTITNLSHFVGSKRKLDTGSGTTVVTNETGAGGDEVAFTTAI